jgi:hypothetical protein
VAGAAAMYLQRHPTANPAAVRSAILDAATAGVLKLPMCATDCPPNLLLYTWL